MPTETLLSKARKEGGFTMNMKGLFVNQNFGYQVSERTLFKCKTDMLNDIVFDQIITMARDIASESGYAPNVGVWVDNDDIYVDISGHWTYLESAIDHARERGEKAIYDWAGNKCIHIGKVVM